MNEQLWLEQYIQDGSQEAFACIVQKHLPLVYGVALRQLHDRHLAEDVAQATFALLARKAASIRDARALPNWLFKAAMYASANALRLEQTRRRHEQKAAAMRTETAHSDQHDAIWQQILPALEQAMETLPDADRQAILLRFYEDRSLREVGESLGVSEEAARKRVDRAVLKLREALVPAGVALGASADLAVILAAHACTQAPAALASSIAATACHSTAQATFATVFLKGATSIMGTATAKVAAVTTAAAVVIGGAAVIVGQVTASGGGPAAPAPAQAATVARAGEPMLIEEAVSRVTIGKTTREELVKLLGEPRGYVWGNQTFTAARLPMQYVMQYDSVSFMMGNNVVDEIRFEGPTTYKFRGRIGFGSPLADVLEVLGQPKKTVEGQAITFEEGVLYRKSPRRNQRTGMFDGYYQRSDQGIRLFFVNDRVVGMYLTRTVAEADNPAAGPSTFTSEKIEQLRWGKSAREDVVKILGEPVTYVWGNQTFTPDALPADVYIMAYSGSDQVVIRQGTVAEIRVHQDGPFRFKGLKVGSSLADVLKAIGQPKATVDGGPNQFKEGVLYRNIAKQPGRGYYQRSDVGVRMFLANDTVTALYLIPPAK